MKNKYIPLFFSFLMFHFIVNAQQNISIADYAWLPELTTQELTESEKSIVINNLQVQALAFQTYYNRSSAFMTPSGQYVSGTQSVTIFYSAGNAGLISEVGANFDNTGSVTLSEVLVMYSAVRTATAMTSPHVFNANIYNSGTDSLPTGSAIGSATITIPNINATNTTLTYQWTPLAFSSPVTVTGRFIASTEVDEPVSGDRDRLYLATNNCSGTVGGPDGDGEKRMCGKIKTSTGGHQNEWHELAKAHKLISSTTFVTLTLNCDPMILPVVQGETYDLGVEDALAKNNGLSFLGHYPSPAKETIKINYELEKYTSVVNLKVFDLTGRTVYETNATNVSAGKYNFDIDVTSFAAGNFYYTLTAGKGSVTTKFTVVK